MIKSRKFIAALALFVAATAFVFTNHTDFTGWADMMKWIFGIYVGGNVGAHTAAKVKIGNGHHAPAAPQPSTPGVIIAQDDVHVSHSSTTTPSPSLTMDPTTPSPSITMVQMPSFDPDLLEPPSGGVVN